MQIFSHYELKGLSLRLLMGTWVIDPAIKYYPRRKYHI